MKRILLVTLIGLSGCDEQLSAGVAVQSVVSSPCFDPAAYGAVPDGDPAVTTQGIMNAIGDAIAAEGTLCKLQPGKYNLQRMPPTTYNGKAALSWHGPNIVVEGQGILETILSVAGDAEARALSVIQLDPGATNAAVRNLTIDTTGLFNTDAGEQTHAIAIGSAVCAGVFCTRPVSNVEVSNVRFLHDGAPGERWGDCIRVGAGNPAIEVRNVRLHHMDFALCGRSGIAGQRNANSVSITDNFFAGDGIGGTALDWEATGGEEDSGLIVANNQFHKTVMGGDNFFISLTSLLDFQITGNIMIGGRGCVSGVRLRAGVISKNTCRVTNATGTIGLFDVANKADGVVLSDNVMERVGLPGHCIKVMPHSDVRPGPMTISGNICTNRTSGASFMLGGLSRASIVGNTIIGDGATGSMGIYLFPVGEPITSVRITANHIEGTPHSSVRLGATAGHGFNRTLVLGNTSLASGPVVQENPHLNPPGAIVVAYQME